jgi:uncharacterized protein (UPF0335 family)
MTFADDVRNFVFRIEGLETEIKELNGVKRDVYKEARATQLDVPALKAVVAYRREDPSKRADLAAVVESYLAAMSPPPASNKRTTDARKPAAGPSVVSLAHAREVEAQAAHEEMWGFTEQDRQQSQSIAGTNSALQPPGDGEAAAPPTSAVAASTNSDDIPECLRRPFPNEVLRT